MNKVSTKKVTESDDAHEEKAERFVGTNKDGIVPRIVHLPLFSPRAGPYLCLVAGAHQCL